MSYGIYTQEGIKIEKSGGSEDQPVGRVAFIEKDMLDKCQLTFSNFIHRIRINEKKLCRNMYLNTYA